MNSPFVPDYLLFTFFSGIGVLQLVFAHHQVRGALFIRRSRRASGLIGAAIVVSAFTWFFASEPRNVSDTTGGMEGSTQVLAFAIGMAGAVAVTLLLTSVINYRWGRQASEIPLGIEGLQHTTYVQAVARNLVNVWRHIRSWTAR